MERSYIITGLLLLLGGPLGLHRFYTGYIGIGFVYLFTAGLLGLGPLYDFIKFTQGEFDDADGEALVGYSPFIGWLFVIIPFLIGITIRLRYFAMHS